MDITQIIKEAFIFPSNDWGKFILYIVFLVVAGFLLAAGFALSVVGLMNHNNILLILLGIILVIGYLIVSFMLMGYLIDITKSGIDGAESAPEFSWKENLITGLKYLVVNIVYYIIPAIIIYITGVVTNLFGASMKAYNLMFEASKNAPAGTSVNFYNVVPHSLVTQIGTAFIITVVVAVVLLIIFSFFETMAESRLANTGSLGEAVNIVEVFKDIGKIGWGKVIAVIVLVIVIMAVINAVINSLSNNISSLFRILSLVVAPYLLFFRSRAIGLLYSDIA